MTTKRSDYHTFLWCVFAKQITKKREETKEVNVSNVDIGKQSPPPKRWKSCENKCLKLKAVIDRKGRDSEKGREEQKEKKMSMENLCHEL